MERKDKKIKMLLTTTMATTTMMTLTPRTMLIEIIESGKKSNIITIKQIMSRDDNDNNDDGNDK